MKYLHNADNNGVSVDTVGPPERLQWTGGTRWGRSHMSWVTVTSILSANGRLFTIEGLESIEYHQLDARFHLVARDAFNGCELWRRPLGKWAESSGYVKHVSTQNPGWSNGNISSAMTAATSAEPWQSRTAFWPTAPGNV